MCEKSWILVKSSKSGLAISHMFFVDDLVLFAKADHINCSTIRDVLGDFCNQSSQSISDSKSRVYFSPNVDIDTRESLCDILGFKSTPNLGKYLGFPIKHQGTGSQDYNFVLDRIKQKLVGLEGESPIYGWKSCSYSSLNFRSSCLYNAVYGAAKEAFREY